MGLSAEQLAILQAAVTEKDVYVVKAGRLAGLELELRPVLASELLIDAGLGLGAVLNSLSSLQSKVKDNKSSDIVDSELLGSSRFSRLIPELTVMYGVSNIKFRREGPVDPAAGEALLGWLSLAEIDEIATAIGRVSGVVDKDTAEKSEAERPDVSGPNGGTLALPTVATAEPAAGAV
jgi:hypothetical protein